MGLIAEFGMGLGLAGAAGIRARYPILILGLLTRYSDQFITKEPFRFIGSSLFLILAAFLVILDFFAAATTDEATGYSYMKLLIKAVVGGIVFTSVFGGFSPGIGILFGGLVAILAYVIDQRLIPFLRAVDSPVSSRHFHELIGFVATVVMLILPLMGYAIWAVLIVLVLRNREWQTEQDTRRYRHLR